MPTKGGTVAADKPAFVTIYNPVNGLPWECPNTDASLAYYLGDKKFTKTPNAKTPAEFKKEGASNG
jgi:hypothetical protein